MNQYKIPCLTEGTDVQTWADAKPTTCPHDAAHEIDTDGIVLVEERGLEAALDENNHVVVSCTHGHYDEHGKFKGFMLTASGNDTTIYDHQITNQIYVQEGYFWSDGGNIGDYAEFSVVDKDDILGLFSYYGLEVGTDVLELGKFVETQYLKPDGMQMTRLTSPTEAAVCSGLYMRTKYENTGNETGYLAVTYLWLEV